MKSARYDVGHLVKFAPSGVWDFRNEPGGTFEVVRRLPFQGVSFEYRLRSTSDGHERVAREGRLMSA